MLLVLSLLRERSILFHNYFEKTKNNDTNVQNIDILFDYDEETRNSDTSFSNATIHEPLNTTGNGILPRFVLHVGPPKTGTTAIQNKFGTKYMGKMLRLDNYTYIGYNTGVLNIQKLLTMNETDGKLTFSNEFMTEVRKEKKLGNNIFGSSEFLRTPTYNQCMAWKSMFLDSNVEGSLIDDQWDLQVVIVYRRLHRSLVSKWNQMFRIFHDKNYKPIHMGHRDWPGVNDEIRIPSFEEWFIKKYYKSTKTTMSTHAAKLSYNSWERCSSKITLVNYHNHVAEDFIAHFGCNALTEATHTCSALKNNEDRAANRSVLNGSADLNYDILAVYAHENGFVHESYNRHQVSRKIEKFVIQNNILLPQKCPNATILDYLYNWSQESETWAFSVMEQTSQQIRMDKKLGKQDVNMIQPLNEERLSGFKADWNLSLGEGKYCNVDSSKTLKLERWQIFFANNFGSP